MQIYILIIKSKDQIIIDTKYQSDHGLEYMTLVSKDTFTVG